jgi:hypothetical protein
VDVVPPVLYRYRSVNSWLIDCLKTSTVYFPSLSQMNDPFEGDLDLISLGSSGDIVGHFDEYIRLVRERFHHFETAFHSIRESCKLSDKDWVDDYAIQHLCSMGDYFKRLYDESVAIRNLAWKARPSAARELLTKFWNTKKREIVDSYGVLSLTESSDNPPMWAYYGDNNRGVCIGYLADVQPVKAWKKYQYHKIHYTEDRALDMLEVGFESTFEKLLTTKSESWSYEWEWRLLTLKGRGPQKANPRAIAKIILGDLAPEKRPPRLIV